jgi:exopolyphosphatase/guanosine-5'-triphosphate,3'-diphosphate pyrophosphatase
VDEARPIAAIDIGTNSIHLVIARPAGNSRFDVLDRDKEVVRLGSGSGDMKSLAPDAIDRGIEALARLSAVAVGRDAEIRAVATSAVREAENRNEFLTRAHDEAGVDIAVISGAEEARLIRLGVLQAVPAFGQRHLLVDIGGGSTEFVIGEEAKVLSARSLKLGAIRLTERFGLDGTIKNKTLDECRDYVRSFLTPVHRDVVHEGYDIAIGSSGTIVNLAEIGRALRDEAPLQQMSGAEINRKDMKAVMRRLTSASADERAEIPGLDPKRADIVVGGAVILEQAFAELGIETMTVSDFALREGVLLDALQRRDRTSIGHLRDLRYESVLHLAAIVPEEREHAERATDLAVELFDQTIEIHQIDRANEEYLEAAGLLANVGLCISHDRHHLHSYYVIRNSDLLTGFTDDEVELIALIARYHRKSAPKPNHAEFAAVSPERQHIVRVLAGILRVAFALDRTRTDAVRSLSVERGKRSITVTLEADGAADLECYTADARKDLLEEALDRSIEFTIASRSGAPADGDRADTLG